MQKNENQVLFSQNKEDKQATVSVTNSGSPTPPSDQTALKKPLN